MKPGSELRLQAIELKHRSGRTLYSFAVDGKLVPTFATISRIRRESGTVAGYQRPEVLSHVAEIRAYIESPGAVLPNAIVIAFNNSVRFEPATRSAGCPADTPGRPGTLVVPRNAASEAEDRPGFIVDGQQRLAAIRDAEVDTFPIFATAFITDDLHDQTEQFILVNSTKPLPKSLIYELLPGTHGALPSWLERRRLPALLLERLNGDGNSPLRGRIQTPTNPAGTIKDNSILRMLENSLSDGVLYRLRATGTNGDNVDEMLTLVGRFWEAVATVFKAAWDLPPRRSRLVHGAGVVSLGFLMDAIADRHRADSAPTVLQFATDLELLRDACRWTDGYWDFGPGCVRKWNELQNTPKDVQLLSNYLLSTYKTRAWTFAPTSPQGRR